MRKILIPTDFSENAMNAIAYAIELFKYEKCDYYIMHAYQDDIYADESLLEKESLYKIRKRISEKSLKELNYFKRNKRKISKS